MLVLFAWFEFTAKNKKSCKRKTLCSIKKFRFVFKLFSFEAVWTPRAVDLIGSAFQRFTEAEGLFKKSFEDECRASVLSSAL